MEDYRTEVELLAVTRPGGSYIADASAFPEGDETGEDLIEYAGRLCYNVEDKTGSRPGWIQDRIRSGHESILEHASATFWIKASRVFTHELVRHRIASYSQRSQRYVNEKEPRYITPPELAGKEVTRELLDKNIISSGFPFFFRVFKRPIDAAETSFITVLALHIFDVLMGIAWRIYGLFLEVGIPKEIARYVLPNACETQIVVTMNFRELRHFITLRTGKAALPEMREVAGKVRDICKEVAPEVFADV